MIFEFEKTIECTVQEAFRACDSAELQIQWVASMIEVNIEDPDNWGNGSRFQQIHTDSGIRQVFQGLVLEYESNRYVTTQLEHKDFTIITKLSFEDLGERCKVTHHSKLTINSFALKMMSSVVSSAVSKRIEEDLRRLQALLEAR
ncbi:MAG: hypothetical protein ACI8X5_002256 [Planctomycetota bacterium]